MGSTLVAAIVAGDEVRWISVGNSPFYMVSAGRLERLNADHSMAPQIDALVARGVITAEEGAGHPGRHTLREAVMGQPLSSDRRGPRRLRRRGAVAALQRWRAQPRRTIDIAVAVGQAGAGTDLGRCWRSASPHQDNVTVIKLERMP